MRGRSVGFFLAFLALWPQTGYTQGRDTARTARPPAAPPAAIDSQAIGFMPTMWMHLDSVSGWSPAQMQRMMATHEQNGSSDVPVHGAGPHDGAGNDGTGDGPRFPLDGAARFGAARPG